MDIAMAEYVEVNTIGIVILLVMLWYMLVIQKYFDKDANRYFIYMLITNIVILVSDTVMYFMRWRKSSVCIFISNLSGIVFFIMDIVFGYLWLMYVIKRLYPKRDIVLRKRLIIMSPCFLFGILVVTSPWTKLIFYINEQNRYIRGDYMWLIMFVLVVYWFIGVCITLREMLNPDYVRENYIYMTLLLFPLPSIIGNFIQMLFYGLSVVWICTAVALLVVFIGMQNIQVSRDMLTGLFNRRQTDKHMVWELDRLHGNDYKLFIMMIDVDYFKSINDKYGHIEGDKALINVAAILRKSFRTRDFIGRFGGDEFIIIGRIKDEQEMQQFLDNMKAEQEAFNKVSNTYKISLSAGYVVYSSKAGLTIDKVIADADAKMYEVKKDRKRK